jgi:broad specificity phosphatase PhoE
MKWDYGDDEGLTSDHIHADGMDDLQRCGGPGGETPEQVGVRVDRVIAGLRALRGDAALFAHGHVLRVLAARWLRLAPGADAYFLLDTASLCVLSSERGVAALKRWNVSPASNVRA